jgi:hypothetical protein
MDGSDMKASLNIDEWSSAKATEGRWVDAPDGICVPR